MSDYFDRVERQIAQRVEAGVPRSTRLPAIVGRLGYVAAVLIVIVVAGAFLLARGAGPTSPAGPGLSPNSSNVLSISFTPQSAPHRGAISHTLQILRNRLYEAVPGARVSWTGGHIVVVVPHPRRNARAQILALSAPGHLEFYDWEGSVIAPNGNTVASLLPDPPALIMSQGSGTAAPGDPGLGSLSLHRARELAAKEPASIRLALVQAVGQGARGAAAQFYVLRGAPALSESDITNPRASTDPNTRVPDVTFNFTPGGAKAFHALTAAVARRGAQVSRLGETLEQHFAVVLDNRLTEVPYVDYKQYPDGISGNEGVDLIAGFTTQSAKDTAIVLRYGPLPIDLTAAG